MSILINRPLEICLKIAGIWPYSVNYLGPLVLMSTLVTTLPFQCGDALTLINDPILLMDSLSDIFAEILIFFKLFMMWMNRSNIKDLLREIIEDWDRKIVPNKWRVLARYCNLFCRFDIAVYVSASLFYYPEIISRYINKPATERYMMFKSQYPFDYHSSPTYEIINLVHVSQAVVMMSIDSLSKSLIVAFIFHVDARIHLLERHVAKYSENCIRARDDNNNKNSEILKLVIGEHLKILILVQRIDSAYSYISLFQIVFSNIIICVTGFVIVTAMESAEMILLIKFILFIIAMLSQCFTLCLVGQYLRNKGELIIDMIYNCLWYNTKPEEIKAVMFVISNAQKPLTLSGGKLFKLSINTFVQVLKSSFSYLSVLRAMYA